MKSKSLFAFILVSSFSFLVSPVSIFAQSITPTATPAPTIVPSVTPKWGIVGKWLKDRQEERQELKDNRQETKGEIKELERGLKGTITVARQDLKATTTQTRDQFRKQRMIASQNGLYNSFVVREKALIGYQTRIQSRLDERKVTLPNSQNLADAQTKLNTLPGLVDTFNKDLASYKATIDSINAAVDPKSLLTTLKTQAKTINDDIKNIRQILVDSLRLIVTAK